MHLSRAMWISCVRGYLLQRQNVPTPRCAGSALSKLGGPYAQPQDTHHLNLSYDLETIVSRKKDVE
jgi:hypothetical protein